MTDASVSDTAASAAAPVTPPVAKAAAKPAAAPVTQPAAAPEKPAPRTVAEIEGELDAVRARLAGRIDDLETYISPKNLIARQVESAKRVFVDEYGGIKPDRVLMVVGAVVVLLGLSSISRRRRRR